MNSKAVLTLLVLIGWLSLCPILYAQGANPTGSPETLIEEIMDDATFRLCGLNKLTKQELLYLDEWLNKLLRIAYEKGKSETKVVTPQPRIRKYGDFEEATIVKDLDGDKVIIERANGDRWILEAKTWCRWSWKYEGKKVLLKFGSVSSELMNESGDICKFWTEEQIY